MELRNLCAFTSNYQANDSTNVRVGYLYVLANGETMEDTLTGLFWQSAKNRLKDGDFILIYDKDGEETKFQFIQYKLSNSGEAQPEHIDFGGGGGSGTSNYNALSNLPTFKGKKLQGEISSLGILSENEVKTLIKEVSNLDNYYTKAETDNKFVEKITGKGLSTNDFTDALKTKLDGIEASADVNTIESISRNNVALTPDVNKNVDISVPTKTSDVYNDSGFIDKTVSELDNYYDKQTVDDKIDLAVTSAYRPGGSLAVADLLPALLVATNYAKLYNITTEGTTTADFIGGAGKAIHIGDEVGIVNVGTNESPVYKFNLMVGDLGRYQTKELSSPITVDGEQKTTVEATLTALNNSADTKLTKKPVLPLPHANNVGEIYLYTGATTGQYVNGYTYQCVHTEESATVDFAKIISCSGSDFLDFLKNIEPTHYEEVTHGTMLYEDAAALWRFRGYDASDNLVASTDQYAGDFENYGFSFDGTAEDQETISFTCAVTGESYSWVGKPTQDSYSRAEANALLAGKVNTVEGKQLSTEDFTTGEQTKLSGIETGAQVNTIESISVNGVAKTPDANKNIELGLANTVESGNMNAVTSNAVYNALEEVGDQGVKDFVRSTPVKMIAHRGWWGVQYPSGEQFPDISQTIPENSYESLKYCANKRFFGMEMDVQLASDGTFWISHNNNLSSTTDSNVNISESTEADLRALTLTNSNCGLPKLDEFMIACRRYNIIPVIELKSETITITSIASFLEILQKTGVANSCFIMSYSANLLKEVYRLRPDIPIQFITDTLSTSIIDNAIENISQTVGFDVAYSAVSAELCNYIHSKNSYIIGWTVSDESDLITATELGCDYVETENTINRAIPEMRKADPVLLSVYPGVSQVYTKPMRRLIDTRVEAGSHRFGEGVKITMFFPDFKPYGLNTDTESENYGKCTRAHGIAVYALPENVLYCHTTLDTTIYKWNIMCLDANGNGCNDYPWCTSPAHRIYNSVENGANPPKWGYIYCMRKDAEYLNDADYAAFEAAEFYIETDFAKSYDSGYTIYRHGNQVTVSVNCQYSGTGAILENLPRPKLSTNPANSIILSCNNGGIISAKMTDTGSIIVDWSSGQITGYLRGSITYTCDDYWETNF